MTEPVNDVADEQATIQRLADAHRIWRDKRLPPPLPEDAASIIAQALQKLSNPEPPDVEIIRAAPEDPLRTAIWSQLSVVGWRLYAKGGIGMLNAMCAQIERDQHPGFVWAVHRAWQNVGFQGDNNGTWDSTVLL